MKRAAAGVLTALLMALLLWRGRSGEGPPPIGPIDTSRTTTSPTALDPLAGASARVQALLESGRAGDVAAYLDAFGPPLRARLERTIAEGGRDAFAAGLKAAAAARRGRAVFDPVADGPDALVTVEFVYDDRNERQTFRLARDESDSPESWRVVDVAGVRGREPASRYGALASFEGPEGNPVEPGAPPPSAPDRRGP